MMRKSQVALAAILIILASGAISFAVSAAVGNSTALPQGTTQYYVAQNTTPTVSSDPTKWHNAGLTAAVTIPAGKTGDVMVVVCADSWANSATILYVRAKIGGSAGAPPSAIFAWEAVYESHCATFSRLGLGAGTKYVQAQYKPLGAYPVELDNRSMIVIVNLH
jgi:hypothetical protein